MANSSSSPYRSIVLLTMIFSFVLPAITWAFEAGSYLHVPGLVHIQDAMLHIPKQLGTVTAHANNSDTVVVCIQDLHCHYEVQQNIASLLECVRGTLHTDLIGVEGAFTPLDADLLRSFPMGDIRNDVADFYMRQGKLTGAEYFAATNREPVQLLGIESEDDYRASQRVVRSFLNAESQGLCLDLREGLEQAKTRVYGPALSRFDAARQRYRSGRLDALHYALQLRAQAGNLRMGLEAFPAAAAFLDGGRPGLEAVQAELEALDRRLREYLYQSEPERRLDELSRRLDIVEKLVNISATQEELDEWRRRPEDFSTRVFTQFLRETGPADMWAETEPTRLDDSVRRAGEFYRLADRRSVQFVDRLLEGMKARPTRRAIMINGGFHTPQVAAELARRGVSYVVIQPAVTRHDLVNPYFSLLQGRKLPVETLLERNQTIMAVESGLTQPGFRKVLVAEMGTIGLAALRGAAGRLQDYFQNHNEVRLTVESGDREETLVRIESGLRPTFALVSDGPALGDSDRQFIQNRRGLVDRIGDRTRVLSGSREVIDQVRERRASRRTALWSRVRNLFRAWSGGIGWRQWLHDGFITPWKEFRPRYLLHPMDYFQAHPANRTAGGRLNRWVVVPRLISFVLMYGSIPAGLAALPGLVLYIGPATPFLPMILWLALSVLLSPAAASLAFVLGVHTPYNLLFPFARNALVDPELDAARDLVLERNVGKHKRANQNAIAKALVEQIPDFLKTEEIVSPDLAALLVNTLMRLKPSARTILQNQWVLDAEDLDCLLGKKSEKSLPQADVDRLAGKLRHLVIQYVIQSGFPKTLVRRLAGILPVPATTIRAWQRTYLLRPDEVEPIEKALLQKDPEKALARARQAEREQELKSMSAYEPYPGNAHPNRKALKKTLITSWKSDAQVLQALLAAEQPVQHAYQETRRDGHAYLLKQVDPSPLVSAHVYMDPKTGILLRYSGIQNGSARFEKLNPTDQRVLPDQGALIPVSSNNPLVLEMETLNVLADNLEFSRGAYSTGSEAIDELVGLTVSNLKAMPWKDQPPLFPERDLDDSQEKGIHAPFGKARVTFIDGAAGTAKTTVLLEILHQAMAQGMTVLLGTETHNSVDQIFERDQSLPVLRVGNPEHKIHSPFWIGNRSTGVKQESVDAFLKNYAHHGAQGKIIAGTMTGLSLMLHAPPPNLAQLFGGLKADLMVVDEATLVTLSKVLALFPHLKPKGRIVLVGSPQQFTTFGFTDDEHEKLASRGIDLAQRNAFCRDAFSRLCPANANNGVGRFGNYVRLSVLYRFHPFLAKMMETVFHPGHVTGFGWKDFDRDTFRLYSVVDPENPQKTYAEPQGKSRQNRRSAQMCLRVARDYQTTHRIPLHRITLLTPYQAQVDVLRDLLTTMYPDADPKTLPTVSTVRAYQGTENDVVIFDPVRDDGWGFLADPRLWYVALSREKTRLAIVCDPRVFLRPPASQDGKRVEEIFNGVMKFYQDWVLGFYPDAQDPFTQTNLDALMDADAPAGKTAKKRARERADGETPTAELETETQALAPPEIADMPSYQEAWSRDPDVQRRLQERKPLEPFYVHLRASGDDDIESEVLDAIERIHAEGKPGDLPVFTGFTALHRIAFEQFGWDVDTGYLESLGQRIQETWETWTAPGTIEGVTVYPPVAGAMRVEIGFQRPVTLAGVAYHRLALLVRQQDIIDERKSAGWQADADDLPKLFQSKQVDVAEDSAPLALGRMREDPANVAAIRPILESLRTQQRQAEQAREAKDLDTAMQTLTEQIGTADALDESEIRTLEQAMTNLADRFETLFQSGNWKTSAPDNALSALEAEVAEQQKTSQNALLELAARTRAEEDLKARTEQLLERAKKIGGDEAASRLPAAEPLQQAGERLTRRLSQLENIHARTSELVLAGKAFSLVAKAWRHASQTKKTIDAWEKALKKAAAEAEAQGQNVAKLGPEVDHLSAQLTPGELGLELDRIRKEADLALEQMKHAEKQLLHVAKSAETEKTQNDWGRAWQDDLATLRSDRPNGREIATITWASNVLNALREEWLDQDNRRKTLRRDQQRWQSTGKALVHNAVIAVQDTLSRCSSRAMYHESLGILKDPLFLGLARQFQDRSDPGSYVRLIEPYTEQIRKHIQDASIAIEANYLDVLKDVDQEIKALQKMAPEKLDAGRFLKLMENLFHSSSRAYVSAQYFQAMVIHHEIFSRGKSGQEIVNPSFIARLLEPEARALIDRLLDHSALFERATRQLTYTAGQLGIVVTSKNVGTGIIHEITQDPLPDGASVSAELTVCLEDLRGAIQILVHYHGQTGQALARPILGEAYRRLLREAETVRRNVEAGIPVQQQYDQTFALLNGLGALATCDRARLRFFAGRGQVGDSGTGAEIVQYYLMLRRLRSHTQEIFSTLRVSGIDLDRFFGFPDDLSGSVVGMTFDRSQQPELERLGESLRVLQSAGPETVYTICVDVGVGQYINQSDLEQNPQDGLRLLALHMIGKLQAGDATTMRRFFQLVQRETGTASSRQHGNGVQVVLPAAQDEGDWAQKVMQTLRDWDFPALNHVIERMAWLPGLGEEQPRSKQALLNYIEQRLALNQGDEKIRILIEQELASNGGRKRKARNGGLMPWLRHWLVNRLGLVKDDTYVRYAWLIELAPMSLGGAVLAAAIAAWTGMEDPLAVAKLFIGSSWTAFAFMHLFPKTRPAWKALLKFNFEQAYRDFDRADWINTGIAFGFGACTSLLTLAAPHSITGILALAVIGPAAHAALNRVLTQFRLMSRSFPRLLFFMLVSGILTTAIPVKNSPWPDELEDAEAHLRPEYLELLSDGDLVLEQGGTAGDVHQYFTFAVDVLREKVNFAVQYWLRNAQGAKERVREEHSVWRVELGDDEENWPDHRLRRAVVQWFDRHRHAEIFAQNRKTAVVDATVVVKRPGANFKEKFIYKPSGTPVAGAARVTETERLIYALRHNLGIPSVESIHDSTSGHWLYRYVEGRAVDVAGEYWESGTRMLRELFVTPRDPGRKSAVWNLGRAAAFEYLIHNRDFHEENVILTGPKGSGEVLVIDPENSLDPGAGTEEGFYLYLQTFFEHDLTDWQKSLGLHGYDYWLDFYDGVIAGCRDIQAQSGLVRRFIDKTLPEQHPRGLLVREVVKDTTNYRRDFYRADILMSPGQTPRHSYVIPHYSILLPVEDVRAGLRERLEQIEAKARSSRVSNATAGGSLLWFKNLGLGLAGVTAGMYFGFIDHTLWKEILGSAVVAGWVHEGLHALTSPGGTIRLTRQGMRVVPSGNRAMTRGQILSGPIGSLALGLVLFVVFATCFPPMAQASVVGFLAVNLPALIWGDGQAAWKRRPGQPTVVGDASRAELPSLRDLLGEGEVNRAYFRQHAIGEAVYQQKEIFFGPLDGDRLAGVLDSVRIRLGAGFDLGYEPWHASVDGAAPARPDQGVVLVITVPVWFAGLVQTNPEIGGLRTWWRQQQNAVFGWLLRRTFRRYIAKSTREGWEKLTSEGHLLSEWIGRGLAGSEAHLTWSLTWIASGDERPRRVLPNVLGTMNDRIRQSGRTYQVIGRCGGKVILAPSRLPDACLRSYLRLWRKGFKGFETDPKVQDRLQRRPWPHLRLMLERMA